MATLTIKNLPDDIYAALTKTAKRNRRSINSEAIRLEQPLDKPKQDTEKFAEEVRKFREELEKKGVYLTDEILKQAKNESRF